MCGIVITTNKQIDDEILNCIAHRGPDDKGVYQTQIGSTQINLGHRRLSILDLTATGHQPMKSSCGKYTIVFNGEIYNHQELRKKINGVDFRGHSDTETVVNYLAQFGIDAVCDLNGIFAFALLDEQKNVVYLARDRFGVKPLYFYHQGTTIVASSEIKVIKQIVKTLTIDQENIALLLRLRYTPSPYTLFNEIERIRPGHIITYNISNNSTLHSAFVNAPAVNRTIKFEEALEQYEYLFEQAIKRQLMSDVEIGILQSGGVDSALVTKFAAKHYPRRLKTFTVGYLEDSESNEFDTSRQISEMFNTDHHEIKIDETDYFQTIREVVNIIEEPLGTTSTIPFHFLCKDVHKHVKVVLTGQGADEPLGGYKRYLAELYFSPWLTLPAKVISNILPESLLRNETFRRSLFAQSKKDVIRRFDEVYALFTKKEILKLTSTTTSKNIETISYFYKLLNGSMKHGVEAMMSNDTRMNLADDLLLLSDKISMRHSIEARVPLLDNDFVSFVESLPYAYRISKRTGKIIHKEFAKRHLKRDFVNQPKKGFNTPAALWIRRSIGPRFKDQLLSNNNSAYLRHLDKNATIKILDLHISGKANYEKQIFTLISLYYWLQDNT